jgi:hypothetical protein
MTTIDLLTLGAAAKRLGCEAWQIRRVFTRRLLPEPGRIGAYRVIHERDLPALKAALIKLGYVTDDEKGVAANGGKRVNSKDR